jgi:hypothetical protein
MLSLTPWIIIRPGGNPPGKVGKITRADIERYQAERLSTPGERKAEVKPATVNREIATKAYVREGG